MIANFFIPILLGALLLVASRSSGEDAPIAFVIHGGAGNLNPEAAKEKSGEAYRNTLKQAVEAGYGLLKEGGSSLDAVERAIVMLEDSPLFNAGKGAVFTSDGANELDASIMDGETLKAGAVGGVTIVKNPISAARAVMERTPHVMLAGPGADQFAKEAGLAIVEPGYFRTERKWEEWQKIKGRDFAPEVKPSEKSGGTIAPKQPSLHLGTVGAVALDRNGHLAAGTSTGGLTNKRYGRIGDSPVIGAGTYADDRTCGISCTGHGEFFIRHVVAYNISARMAHGGNTLPEAAREVVQEELRSAGGRGGIIGIDGAGRVVVEFNTPGMFRAWIGPDGKAHIETGG